MRLVAALQGVLQQQGITTANELAGYTEKELRTFPNLGAASVTSIKKALHALDFRLGDLASRKLIAQRQLEEEGAPRDPARDPRLKEPAEHHTQIREVELAAKFWMWLDNCAQILGCTTDYYLKTVIAKAWAKDDHGGRSFGRSGPTGSMKREDFKEMKRGLHADDGL